MVSRPVVGGRAAPPAGLIDRLCRIRALAREIYAERPDLRATFHSTDSDDFWIWLDTSGRSEYPALAEHLVALPSPRTRAYVGAKDDFLEIGAAIYRLLLRVSREFGPSFASPATVLDFGCGPGRGLRHLLRHADTLACTGTDVDALAVDWCRLHFPFGEFTVNCDIPPTDFPSASFDLIFAVSVFSHLEEDNHVAWLAELRRLARPGGVVVITIHGEHALRRTLAEPALRQFLSLAESALPSVQEQVASHQYAFVRQPESHLNPDRYGLTFIARDYVLGRWSRELDVVAYWEAALKGWQDAVILRAPR